MLYTKFESISIFDAVEFLGKDTDDIRLVAIVILPKLKLLFDLEALETTTKVFGPKVPLEILDSIRLYIPASSIITSNPELLRRNDHSATARTIRKHIRLLYKRIVEVRIALKRVSYPNLPKVLTAKRPNWTSSSQIDVGSQFLAQATISTSCRMIWRGMYTSCHCHSQTSDDRL
jgi:hypothetical protein